MRPTLKKLLIASLMVGAITCISASAADAQQNLTWDPNGAAAGTGGTGVWNTTSSFWFNGATFQPWNNSTFDNAIFAGTAGIVTVGTPITVHDMTFNVGGYLFTTAGTITLGGVNPTITTNVGATQLFPALGGSTGFTKNGAGTLQLGGVSVGYTGVTTVNAGRLVLSSSAALGFSTAANRLVLNNGVTLSISTPPLAYNYTLTGGSVNVELNLSTWGGVPTLTAPTTLILSGSNPAGVLSGNLADTGPNILSLTRNGSGRVTLSGNNSYTGATTVTQGALQLGSVGALSAGSNLVFNGVAGTGGAIELTSNSGNFTRSVGTGAGQVQWLGSGGFSSSGSNRIVNLGGAGAMLTWGIGNFVPDGSRLILGTASNNTLDFQNGIDLSGGVRSIQGDGGLVSGGARLSGTLSGSGGLNKVGNGFLELTGANTYLGGTVITSGTLLVGSDINLGATSGILTFDGGTLQNTAAFETGRSITINAPGGTFLVIPTLVVSGPISGAGRLTKAGAASLIITGADTHSGGTTISAGTLQIGNGGTTGTIAGSIANNGVLAFNRSDSLVFGGAVTGAGSLEQRGAGTTILSGGSTYTGGTTISAGTLQIGNGGTIGSITGGIVNDGVLAFNRADDLTFAGAITGGGALDQRGSGSTTLSGANTYSGGTVLTAGTLVVGADANLGAASGTLTFDGGTLRNTGAFATGRDVTLIAPGGTIQTDADLTLNAPISGSGHLTKTGLDALILTSDSDYTGDTTITAGTLQLGDGGITGGIVGDVTNNGALAFDLSDTHTFSGAVSGAGNLDQLGTGNVTLSGNSAAFTGTTSIVDGTLTVDGVLGGTLNVFSGGRLQGTGTIGTTSVASGGTLAPGAPAGTLTVAGNVSFSAGSIFEAKTDSAGTMSLLHATGAATIGGGTVNVVAESSVFQTGARYTILTADTGRTGQFAGLTETLPLLDMTLAYGPNEVFLDVARNSTTLCGLAVTHNQCATSTPDAALGPSNPVVDAVRSLPDLPSIQNALDLLSGEIHASVKGVMLENSRYLRDTVTDRARQALAVAGAPETGAPGVNVAALGAADMGMAEPVSLAANPSAAQTSSRGVALWGSAFGALGHESGDGNAARIDTSVGGFFVGADTLIDDDILVGVAAGHSNSSFDVNKRASSASSDDYHVALYGGTQWGALGLRFGAGYSWHDIETDRSIVFPGFSDAENANYTAGTAQVFGEAGYTLTFGDLSLEPFARVAYVRLDTDSLKENGGAAALSASDSTEEVTYTTLGMNAAQSFLFSNGMSATAHGALGWRHAFGDLTPQSTQAIDGSTFVINGTPIAEDALVIDAGVDLEVSKGVIIGLSYNGQIAQDAADNGVQATLSWRF